MSSLTVYSKNACQACETVKAVLKSKGIAFTERNVDEDTEALRFVVEKRHRAMPVVYNDGVWVQDLNTL